ncbi:hypothetical protein AAB97_000206 [Salmonella enterica subsp. enterica]|nr:hypothetical protein [Salmonella enterica subsp. enterica]
MSLLQRVYGHDELTMEAIKFQDGSLFKEMTEFFKTMDNLTSYEEKVKYISGKPLSDLIRKYTGLTIQTEVIPNMSEINCFCITPDITKNNVLIEEWRKQFYLHRDFKQLSKNIDEIVGVVDLVNGRVKGAFEKIVIRVFVTDGFIRTMEFTPENKAALVMHEVGHAFTFLEFIAESAKTDFSLATATRELLQTTDKEKKITLAKSLNDAMGTTVDVNVIAESSDVATWYTVYISNKEEQARVATHTGRYSDTSAEFVADQFVTRHGGGAAMADTLAKIYKHLGKISVRDRISIWTQYAVCSLSVISAIAGLSLINPILGTMGTVALFVNLKTITQYDFTYSTYTSDKDRVAKLKQELVGRLKDRDLPQDIRVSTLDAIKEIDKILKTLNDNRTIMELITIALRPDVHQAVKQEQVQKTLSTVINNDLFKTAATLDSIIA